MGYKKILIVDDEKEIIDFISVYLKEEGFLVFSAATGDEALQVLKAEEISLIILDIMLPDIEGTDLCLNLRKISDCPIIFASCKSNDIDKVIALGAGGDDYITKPFSGLEIVARVKAHLRRSRMFEQKKSNSGIISYPGISINPNSYEVTCGEKQVILTAKEFEILLLLMKNPKRVYSADQIYETVWKEHSLEGDFRTIIVYIRNIRKKIEPDPSKPKYILTVRGVGYKFNSNPC